VDWGDWLESEAKIASKGHNFTGAQKGLPRVNELIGAAVYLVLALAVAVGARAVFTTARPKKMLNSVTARTQSPLAVLAEIVEEAEAQRQNSSSEHEHALPWVIPTDSAPVAAYMENKKAPTTIEEIAERLVVVESRLDRITGIALD
jgi:hypothetical protein